MSLRKLASAWEISSWFTRAPNTYSQFCGVTLFHGTLNPLRYERLSLYRFTLPEAMAEEEGRWNVRVDLALLLARMCWGEFEPDIRLSASDAELGEHTYRMRVAIRHEEWVRFPSVYPVRSF